MRVRPRTARYTRRVEAYSATPTARGGPRPMRAWDEAEEAVRRRAERRAEEDAETRASSTAGSPRPGRAAIDAATPARTRPADAPPRRRRARERPRAPARALGPGERPVVGHRRRRARSGTALGVALDRAGWPVGAVASRDPARRERFRARVPGARAFAEANALVDDVELVILAVPDDVVAPLAALAPAVRGPGDRPHERPARRGGPRAGAGRRDAGRRLPPAGRVRGPRPGARGAPRRDDRDRGRRRARRAPRRHGRGDRRRAGPARARARRPPTTRRPSSRPAASPRSSTRSARSRRSSASTRPARCAIYLPLRRADGGQRPRARDRRPRSPVPRRAATPGRSTAHLAALGRGRPGRARRLPGAAGARRRASPRRRGALSPEAAERLRTALAGDP